MTRFFIAILLVALLNLSACGQTGDLYLPDDEQDEVEKNENDNDKTKPEL